MFGLTSMCGSEGQILLTTQPRTIPETGNRLDISWPSSSLELGRVAGRQVTVYCVRNYYLTYLSAITPLDQPVTRPEFRTYADHLTHRTSILHISPLLINMCFGSSSKPHYYREEIIPARRHHHHHHHPAHASHSSHRSVSSRSYRTWSSPTTVYERRTMKKHY